MLTLPDYLYHPEWPMSRQGQIFMHALIYRGNIERRIRSRWGRPLTPDIQKELNKAERFVQVTRDKLRRLDGLDTIPLPTRGKSTKI